jgi:structural maintenance of chromosome 4
MADESSAQPTSNERLIITHMTLENFKSYAGVQQIGPFHKRFSSVVGPNGSGKSNVIDAMLFVFGKRAKQLRLNKVSELIHKSEAFMDLEMCKVSVHFVEIIDRDLEGDDFTVIPGSELEISRAAFKDNSNKYYINDRASNFKEVTTLLKAKGIDLDHNRFLILQGEVEQISLMPPKARNEHETGMLEYLEDIIGSNRLVESIEESGKQVDALNEERGQKVTKLKIVEKDKENLDGAKAEAEEYMLQQRKLQVKKGLLYQIYLNEVRLKIKELEEKKERIDTKLREEKSKLDESSKEVQSIEGSYQTEKSAFEQIEAELKRAKDEFAVFERKDVQCKEEIKHLKAKEKKIQENIKKEQEKVEKARETIVKQEKAIKDAEATVKNMEQQIPNEQKILDALFEASKGETAVLREQLEKAQAELVPWTQSTNEAQAAVDMTRSELQLAEEKSKKAQEALDSARQKLKAAEPTRKAKNSELKSKEGMVSKLEQQILDGKKEQVTFGAKEQSMRQSVNELRAKLEDSKASSKASRSQSSVLKSLMDAKKAGKVSGVHGRLGDLGGIDGRYDVAISSACGALENIVVDNTAVAQWCCDHLRRTGAGVATFLMLDKQQHLAEKMQSAAGSFPAPRLFDLVRPKDPKYLPAFYFALRDTLVADDLDAATKIAYQGSRRFRVVTLDGAVIDVSGAMTGGGNKVNKGGMGQRAEDDQAVSAKDLEVMEKQLAQQSDELTSIRGRLQALEKAIAGWERELQAARTDAEKLALELQALGKEEEELRANMGVFEADAVVRPEDVRRAKELRTALELNEKALAKAKGKSDAIEGRCKELQQQIMDAGGPKLRMQKTKVEGMTRCGRRPPPPIPPP